MGVREGGILSIFAKNEGSFCISLKNCKRGGRGFAVYGKKKMKHTLHFYMAMGIGG